jgi:hypothetical protein
MKMGYPMINRITDETRRNKKELSPKVKRMLMNYSIEAYELDKSRSLSWYYEYYVNYLRQKWREMDAKEREKFFDNGIIEV